MVQHSIGASDRIRHRRLLGPDLLADRSRCMGGRGVCAANPGLPACRRIGATLRRRRRKHAAPKRLSSGIRPKNHSRNPSENKMISHDVKVSPSKANLKREDQLAWKFAVLAADKVAVPKDVAEMIINRIIDNASVAIASVNRRSVT